MEVRADSHVLPLIFFFRGGSLLKGSQDNSSVAVPQQDLGPQVEVLKKEEVELDGKIQQIQDEIKHLQDNYANLLYVEYGDIRNIPSMADQTVIAVRAAPGTTLEVPEPDVCFLVLLVCSFLKCGKHMRKYEIFLQSEIPIDVFVVHEHHLPEAPVSNHLTVEFQPQPHSPFSDCFLNSCEGVDYLNLGPSGPFGL